MEHIESLEGFTVEQLLILHRSVTQELNSLDQFGLNAYSAYYQRARFAGDPNLAKYDRLNELQFDIEFKLNELDSWSLIPISYA